MTRRDFDLEDKFQEWLTDDNFDGFVETIEDTESTPKPIVPAYRLGGSIVYQHPGATSLSGIFCVKACVISCCGVQ